jgi:hypothetical protein
MLKVKKINKIIIWVLSLLTVAFICSGIAIALYGKNIVVSQIEKNLKMKASLASMSLSLPFNINLTDVKIGNLLAADRIIVSPNILGVFSGKIILTGLTIINPVINIEQYANGTLNLPKLEHKAKSPPLLLTGLTVENGRFTFIDKKISSDGFRIIMDNVNARIYKVMLPPTSLNTKFRLSTSFIRPDGSSLGNASASGWVDFGPKDMDAILEIKDLDIAYFHPYYGNIISDKKLLSARLNLASNLKAENNNLTVVSDFRLSDLVYAKEEDVAKEREQSYFDLAKNALDIFSDEKGNLDLEFTINTKLDNPDISSDELKKAILNAAVKNLSNQPPDKLREKISNTIEQFKEFGKELKDIFKKGD